MTRRLSLALAASVLIALPVPVAAAKPPLHPDGAVVAAKSTKKSAAKKKADAKAPVIKKITPRDAKVGDTLTITGKNFVRGKGKNQVFFYTTKGGGTFTKAGDASATRLKVEIPRKLANLLPANGDKARILIRVKSKRLGARTAPKISPLIAINPDDVGGDNSGPGAGGANPIGCTPAPTNPVSDVDQDRLSDALERTLLLDACNRDSDGDGASDGYEYYSAIDLNSQALPYPFKTPYPNALFKDAEVDYDGDGLTLWDEYSLWTKYGQSQIPLNYSDGKQATQPQAAPDPSGPLYALDMNHNGTLSDDERDADGDALSNWDESHGRMLASWWKSAYDGTNGMLETPYPVTFGPVSMIDPDSDGDGVLDGADDTDFDGLTNAFEVERPVGGPRKSVTGEESDDTFTAAGHGFQNGDLIVFPVLTGGTGLTVGNRYYVVSATPNTFEVSATTGGAAVNFTTDVTAGTVREASHWLETFVATGYTTSNFNPNTNLADLNPATPAVDGGFRYYSRVQPFNPCKPVWSGNCHIHWPFGYYAPDEPWMGWGYPGANQTIPAPGARPGDV